MTFDTSFNAGYVVPAIGVIAFTYLLTQTVFKNKKSPPTISTILMVKMISKIMKQESIADSLLNMRKTIGSSTFFVEIPFIIKILFVLDLDDIQAVFEQERKLELRVFLPPTVEKLHGNRALQHISGDDHKKWRKILNAVFSPRALNAYVPYLLKEFSATWAEIAESGNEFVLREVIRNAQLKVMTRMLYGIDARNDSDKETYSVLDKEFEIALEGLFANEYGETFKSAMESSKKLKQLLSDLFKRRLNSERYSKDSTLSKKFSGDEDYNALDAIIEELTDEQKADDNYISTDVAHNLYLLLEAAHGTTMYATTAILGELHRPDSKQADHARDILRNEMQSIKEFTLESSLQMKYAEACFYEGTRLLPIAPLVSYEYDAGKKLILPSGYEIDGPMKLQLGTVFPMNEDPSIFPENTLFIPDRWLDDSNHPYKVSEKYKKAFLIFGTGQHMCIGYKLAYLTIKAHLYTFFKRPETFQVIGEMKIRRALFPACQIDNGVIAKFIKEQSDSHFE